VLRLVRNPEGYASESDGTYSYQFNRETASGRLEILAEEWERLGISSLIPQVHDGLTVVMPLEAFGSG
jgi:hypothetical protein